MSVKLLFSIHIPYGKEIFKSAAFSSPKIAVFQTLTQVRGLRPEMSTDVN